MSGHQPFISGKDTKTPEFTFKAIFLGVILGVIFAIANAYLGLKVGLTVSASIPAAMISMLILRTFFKKASILENNLVQTIASVGEGLAAGVIFTVPALFILGVRLAPGEIFLLSFLGGILGVLFMIPMRRYLIVQEHGKLPFPEGTACAEILKAGASSRHRAVMALWGITIGAIHKICSSALFLFKETPSWILSLFQKTEFSMDCTPAVLGVGFIIGPRISTLMFAGGAIGWWVIIPLIQLFATGDAIIFPAHKIISEMSAEEVWSNYVRYIGVGAIAAGGLLSLYKIFPLIIKTLKLGLDELFQGPSKRAVIRTERDISLKWLIVGSVLIIALLWLIPGLSMNFVTIVLLAVLSFFFVAVTSLTVGICGSTSNPVSGMTIITLLFTCLVFILLGWTQRVYLVAALTMSVVANVAICLGATTSQDLKTGFLLGATPQRQQIGEIIGLLLPALSIGVTLYLLDRVYTLGSSLMPAPQGTMMALIAKGVMEGNIPTTLVVIGVVIGLLCELLKLPVLPFAIGLYLPLSLSTSVMIGGLVANFVKRKNPDGTAMDNGMITASGLVAGDAATGVVIALLTVLGWVSTSGSPMLPLWTSLAIYALLALFLGWFCLKPPFRITNKTSN
jgi:putative OPT family oligopeptide transporter